MRTFLPLLALSMVVASGAFAANPTHHGGGGGSPNLLPPSRDVCWSEPPDLYGLIASSEVIGIYGLETEIVNDFWFSWDQYITYARWWGGYWNNNGCGDIGYATNWNLRFYNSARRGIHGGDGGSALSELGSQCLPWGVVAEYPATYAYETFVYCQSGIYPIFEYQASVSAWVAGQGRYWFGAQAADHTFPPEVGRLASGGVVGCDAMFRSAYFSYPDWTPAIDVFGVAFDASQEFECGGGTPREVTTWGAVRGLYR
jgi:hypothetical protein